MVRLRSAKSGSLVRFQPCFQKFKNMLKLIIYCKSITDEMFLYIIDIEYNDISLSKLEETIKGYHPEFDKIVDIKQLFDPDQVIHIYERTRGWSGGPR